jgi:hypothetical protein
MDFATALIARYGIREFITGRSQSAFFACKQHRTYGDFFGDYDVRYNPYDLDSYGIVNTLRRVGLHSI